ncbi:MAG TPA: UvrD-helicase domain-containing protein [Ktedonobacterales bacterium]|jgi:hypothetical protein
MKQTSAQVALSEEFLVALGKLPLNVQPRVRDCMRHLYQNPTHPSLNYEAIHSASDPCMRSIRINEGYRAIVAHPDGTGTYVLLWVDKHDAAYDWASRHVLNVDDLHGLTLAPITRSQSPLPAEIPPAPTPTIKGGVLEHLNDAQLLQVGVTKAFLPVLRACATDDDLLEVLQGLRQEIAEAVMCLALGQPLAVAVEEVQQEPEPPTSEVQPVSHPLEVALQRPENRRRFVVLTSQHELEQALEYPLERWRLFLHPSQQDIVQRHFDGPALVSGGAGTGKTVVGLHRAYYLATHVFTAPSDRILLTTFTTNLAENLSTLMDSLCGSDQATRKRIDVIHVHSLAARLRRSVGEQFGILEDQLARTLMTQAVQRLDTLKLPVSFYLSEWTEVVQEREALTQDEYLQVDRAGRGKALNPQQRLAIWPVLEAYGQAVKAAKREEWPDVMRRVRHLLSTGQLQLPAHYRTAIIDEAQDMGTPEIRLVLSLTGIGPDGLLLLGDTRQQIYARGAFVRLLSIPIGRRHHRLRLNYRTTEQIRSSAAQLVTTATALNGDALTADDLSLLSGPAPTVKLFPSLIAEQEGMVAALKEVLSVIASEEVAVVARTNALVNQYQHILATAGIPHTRLEAKVTRGPGVQLATMHRVKGLEFRAVFIVGCSSDVLPQPYIGDGDEMGRLEHLEREQRLLYVSMTRARELLWMSGAGSLSPIMAAQ